jgi:hypothetical protein
VYRLRRILFSHPAIPNIIFQIATKQSYLLTRCGNRITDYRDWMDFTDNTASCFNEFTKLLVNKKLMQLYVFVKEAGWILLNHSGKTLFNFIQWLTGILL